MIRGISGISAVRRAVTSGGGTSVSDSFTRANGALGSNWVSSNISIISNAATNDVSGGADGFALWQGSPSIPNDQFTQVTVQVKSTLNQYLLLRSSDDGGTCYAAFFDQSNNQVTVNVFIAGTDIANSVPVNYTLSNNDIIYFSVIANVLTIKANGTTLTTYTDSGNNISTGRAGFGMTTSVTCSVINWLGGSAP